MSDRWRVLLVEDEQYRIDWFRDRYPDLDVTGDVDEAITWLQDRVYNELFLDHDLGTEPKVGRDVAKWLAAHPAVQPWLNIVVHSVNVVSAPKIVTDLAAGGRHSGWIPFTAMKFASEASARAH